MKALMCLCQARHHKQGKDVGSSGDGDGGGGRERDEEGMEGAGEDKRETRGDERRGGGMQEE